MKSSIYHIIYFCIKYNFLLLVEVTGVQVFRRWNINFAKLNSKPLKNWIEPGVMISPCTYIRNSEFIYYQYFTNLKKMYVMFHSFESFISLQGITFSLWIILFILRKFLAAQIILKKIWYKIFGRKYKAAYI